MARQPAMAESLQVIGSSEEPLPSPRRRAGGAVLAAAAIAAAMLLVAVYPVGAGEAGRAGGAAPLPDISPAKLLHPIGGPVDVVERFMAAISYGESELAVQALAPDSTMVNLPFLLATPHDVAGEVAVYRDTRAVISMHGCSMVAAQGASAEVGCAISFDSDFVRDLESKNLQGSLRFLVDDGLISSVSVVELESPVDGGTDVDGLFDKWLVDFYFPGA
jgi:hypothetical protein